MVEHTAGEAIDDEVGGIRLIVVLDVANTEAFGVLEANADVGVADARVLVGGGVVGKARAFATEGEGDALPVVVENGSATCDVVAFTAGDDDRPVVPVKLPSETAVRLPGAAGFVASPNGAAPTYRLVPVIDRGRIESDVALAPSAAAVVSLPVTATVDRIRAAPLSAGTAVVAADEPATSADRIKGTEAITTVHTVTPTMAMRPGLPDQTARAERPPVARCDGDMLWSSRGSASFGSTVPPRRAGFCCEGHRSERSMVYRIDHAQVDQSRSVTDVQVWRFAGSQSARSAGSKFASRSPRPK